jgi:hypothetical protein
MSEANVEVTLRHYEIRHGKGRKRRTVGRDDWSWEHPRAVDRARTEMRSLHVSHHRRIVARTGQADPPIDGRMTAITLIGNYVDRHIALESQVRTALDRARPPCGTRFVPQLSPALKLRLPGKEGVEQRLVL